MIVTQLDSTYAPWLDLFLSSLRRTNPQVSVYVELVNFHPNLAAYFESKYSQTNFVPISLDQPTRRLMAHRKVDAALNAIGRHAREPWYIVCDVDLLFRDSLDDLIAELMAHDAGVVFREGLYQGQQYEYLRVACGFVAYKDARLISAWKRQMEKPTCRGLDSNSWFYDQITLLDVAERLPLNYLAIDANLYVNKKLSTSAVIWSASWEPKELMYLKFLEDHYGALQHPGAGN
jgi:hypothetical protein